jgi:hypothetical protein
MPHAGVWADRGQGKQPHPSGVRIDGGVVVMMTEERDW